MSFDRQDDPHGEGAVLHAGAPLASASLAVVLLHGRGASADDILQLGAALDLPNVAYLAPQAAGSTWYPLSFLAPRRANESYLSSALRRIASVVGVVDEAGVPRRRIAIAGFSQGACLATEFVASNPARYAGLVAFTGGLIGEAGATLSGSHSAGDALQGTPALLCSGDPDPHVPWQRVEESAAILRRMGAAVETKRYPGRGHTVTADEIRLAREVLLAAERTAQ